MKRWVALLLILMLSAMTLGSVHAENVAAAGDGLSLYIGEGDVLWEVGRDQPVGESVVSAIYAADSLYAVYATSVELIEDHDREKALYLVDLSGAEPVVEEICGEAVASAWSQSDGLLYYVCYDEPDTLYSYDPVLFTNNRLIQAGGAITALRMSADGLLATVGQEELLYVPVVKLLAAPVFSHQGYTLQAGVGFETLLDGQGNLFLRRQGGESTFQLGTGVTVSQIAGSFIYYLTGREVGMELMAYNTETGAFSQMCYLEQDMLPQLAVGQAAICLMDDALNLYAYQLLTGSLTRIGTAPQEAVLPVVRMVADTALVYDDAAEPGQRFVQAIPLTLDAQETGTQEEVVPAPEAEEEVPAPVATPKATPKPTVKPTATPAPEARTLSKGMRGDDVQAMQAALKKHGYLSGAADGIFGSATQTALLYLQGDMGLSETGKASPSLQEKLLSGKVPDYEKYVALSKGDEGIRVQDLQTRLRTLGYMTVNAGGHYQTATTAAVKRFQKQMGYKQTGNITVSQMRALFKSSCPECTEYYTLSKGDSSPAVKRLNKRLKQLGYFSGTAGESFGKATVAAIEKFQSYNGLRATGECDANLQSMIYSPNAKHYQPITPDPTPAPSWNQPTAKQLKTMRTWMNKHFGAKWGDKKVANKIQEQLSELGYLDWGYQSGVYDKATWEAVKSFQLHDLGDPSDADGIADKATLKALFS